MSEVTVKNSLKPIFEEYFDRETNERIHHPLNSDAIWYWYNELPQSEKSFVKDILFCEAPKYYGDTTCLPENLAAGLASLREGICLKEELPLININSEGIFFMSYRHDPDNYYNNGTKKEGCEWRFFSEVGEFDFYVNSDPKFIEYIRNDGEFYAYCFGNNYEFRSWLEKKKILFDYENSDPKFIKYIHNDGQFNRYYRINDNSEFSYWLDEKKKNFDYIEDRKKALEIRLNDAQEADSELLQLIIDSNLQEIKELLIEMKKDYPRLFRRWTFNWQKFRFERNPLCFPSLENLNDILLKLSGLEDDKKSGIFNQIRIILNYNNKRNLDFQQIKEYILSQL